MKNLDLRTRERLIELAKRNLHKTDDFEVTIWLRVLPIFRFVSKQPLIRSVIVSLSLFVFIVLANLDDISFKLLTRHFTLAVEVFIGLYAGFYFSKVTTDGYYHLSRITLLPRETFQRWFASGISAPFGKVNLLSKDAWDRYRLSNVVKEDRQIFSWFVTWNAIMIPVLFIILDVPALEMSVGALAQYLGVFLWGYTWLWTPHWVVFCILFLVRLSRLPVRYFYGMPDSLTLKGVGDVVARANIPAFFHFLFLVPFLYFWEVIPRGEESAKMDPLVILIFLSAFASYIVVSSFLSPLVTQVAITKSMLQNRKRKLAEYSNHLEKAFDRYMRSPTTAQRAAMLESQENMKILYKLPIFGMTTSAAAFLLFVFLIDIFVLYVYLKISFVSWRNFLEIFSAWG